MSSLVNRLFGGTKSLEFSFWILLVFFAVFCVGVVLNVVARAISMQLGHPGPVFLFVAISVPATIWASVWVWKSATNTGISGFFARAIATIWLVVCLTRAAVIIGDSEDYISPIWNPLPQWVRNLSR